MDGRPQNHCGSCDSEDLVVAERAQRGRATSFSGCSVDHDLASSVFTILFEGNSDAAAIRAALRHLGQSYGAARSFIVETYDEGISYHLTDEWCREGPCVSTDEDNVVPGELVQDCLDWAETGDIYVCYDVKSMIPNRALPHIIASRDAKSFLSAQVRRESTLTMFIGVEDWDAPRIWTPIEANTLRFIARVMSVTMQRSRLNDEVKQLSEHGKIAAYIGDNTDNFIYITDPETFEVLHLNKKALAMYGNPSEEVWRSQKCYEFLHNKTDVCEFCTNRHTTEDAFYEWEYYHPRFDRTYLFRDKLIPLNGKLAKLQVATDITRLVTLETELTQKIAEQDLLLDCIRLLHGTVQHDASVEAILSIVCHFFEASRGVIMQITDDDTVRNSHEWTDGVTPAHKSELQHLPLAAFQELFDAFAGQSAVYVPHALDVFQQNKELHSILQKQGLESLMCAPILAPDGKYIGLLGLDNPKKKLDKHWLLGSLSAFVSDFLEKDILLSELHALSYYDTLTGIKNRHSYRRALKDIEQETLSALGVVYVDITGLARINEEKGMQHGDKVICIMADLLTEAFGEQVFRVGGDEFVALVKNIDERSFEQQVTTLRSWITAHADLRATVGFTWNTDFGDDDSGCVCYHSLPASRNYTAILSRNLDREIRSGKYVVYLQPQMDLHTMTLIGAEALIRRLDAEGCVQPPIAFVPFYEREGMISKIDLFVFETVCRSLQSWEQRGFVPHCQISVNFSRSTIMEQGIVSKLSAICSRFAVAPSLLIVEITETISQSDDKLFVAIISSFKEAGFCVSLDDFGSGHANLSTLISSNFDEIKIDMSLTRDLEVSDKAKLLSKVALDLCDALPTMDSVAEGIETAAQCEILRTLGCQKGQGYYFSKPISIVDFEQTYFLDNR